MLRKRLCFFVDLYKLNIAFIKNCYLLWLVVLILNCLCKIKMYTKLDIILAFNFIKIIKNNFSLKKFETRFDLYKYLAIFWKFIAVLPWSSNTLIIFSKNIFMSYRPHTSIILWSIPTILPRKISTSNIYYLIYKKQALKSKSQTIFLTW